MVRITPKSLAGLAMALCHQIGLENNSQKGTRAMKGVYVTMQQALEGMKEERPGDSEMPSCDDMEDQRWQVVFSGILATLSARKQGREATVEHMSNMFQHIEASVETYKTDPSTCDKIARVVLDDLYPNSGGLTDGHQRAGNPIVDIS